MVLKDIKQTKAQSAFEKAKNEWATQLPKLTNPLNITSDDVDESLELCPPKKYKNFVFLGREFIPTTQVRHNPEEQSRDKEVDNDHTRLLKHDLEQGFLASVSNPAPCVFNPEMPFQVEAMGGFHRKPVLEELHQQFYMFDVYVYVGETYERDKWVMRNQSNLHRGTHKIQTRNDYVKEVSNGVMSGYIDNNEEAIRAALDEICDWSKQRKDGIVKQVTSNCQTYANFRTYTSQNHEMAKYTLRNWLRENGIVNAGIEHRDFGEIQSQGYISYCCAEGNNKSTWMRAITHHVTYGVPVYLFGYASTREDDLVQFREQWIEDFENQKLLLLDFFKMSPEDYPNEFPVKIAGFLPQYIKPDAKHKGRSTETTLVDQYGAPLIFNKDRPCLSRM